MPNPTQDTRHLIDLGKASHRAGMALADRILANPDRYPAQDVELAQQVRSPQLPTDEGPSAA
jgi:hypothetical protein